MKRGRQSTTTPQALRQGNRAVTKATRYPEGGTSTETGPGRRKGPTTGGREATTGGGGEPATAKQRTKTRKPHHTESGTQRPKRRHPQKRRQKHQQNKTQQKGAWHERKRREDQRQTEGKESTAQTKKAQKGGQEGDRTPRKQAKRPPPRNSKWEQVTKRCPGPMGTEDRHGVNETPSQRGRRRKGEGRYVILRVVYSR